MRRYLPIQGDMYINIISRQCIVRYTEADDNLKKKIKINKRCFPLVGHQKKKYLFEIKVTKNEAIQLLKEYQSVFKIKLPDSIINKISNPRRQVQKDYSHINHQEPNYKGGDFTPLILELLDYKDHIGIRTVKKGYVELRLTTKAADYFLLNHIDFLNQAGTYSTNLAGKSTRFIYTLTLSPIVCYFLADVLKATHENLAMRLLAFSDISYTGFEIKRHGQRILGTPSQFIKGDYNAE